MAAVADGTAKAPHLSLPRNATLCLLAAELQFGSAVFDRELMPQDNGGKLLADSALVRAAVWYQRAKVALQRELDSDAGLVDGWPQLDVEALKIFRWRDLLIKTKELLVKLGSNARSHLNSVRDSVKESPYLMPDQELAAQRGGGEFLRALQAYNRAGKSSDAHRTRHLLSANTHVDAVLGQSSDGDFLIPLASLLKALILFRARNVKVAIEVASRAPKPERLQDAFEDLARACKTGVLRLSERIGNEVHLTDLFEAWPADASGDRGNNGSST
jgi:hypothetical protein